MSRIAFVGLGTMGAPIARHLVGAGHEVVGFDVQRARVDELGLVSAASAAEAVTRADAAFTSLPALEDVREVWLGAEGLAAGARPGTLLVDLSTGSPALARELAETLEPRGLDVLDAPVSGGPHGAEEGALTVMVGGREEAYERARPLLEAFGRHVVRIGGHGAGQTAKLCNNLVAGVTMAGLAEACAIAEHEGVDATTLFEVLAASTGDSRVLRVRFPLSGVDPRHPSSRDWQPLFALDLIAKDLGLVVELAETAGVEAGVTQAALAEYGASQAAGHGRHDYSAVFLRIREGAARVASARASSATPTK
ncbi:MAG TPA: NAD(P)-dependent oxidoreductase [Gaiellaceae bacterium]|nr:NAD(P)-dependent oxidoreductase [Gaiellaceae bacterium]